ncbi:uncharacterized protein LOC143258671 isoform X1 [Tachypleus tridentatus]|uniref:uncharacterized protein LOC143258671 isoform X1 n=1 Tax=Tachypleus tridentatus TaxID=6853 RepID=UPI003FD66EB9
MMHCVDGRDLPQYSASKSSAKKDEVIYTICGQKIKISSVPQSAMIADMDENVQVTASVGPHILYPQTPSLERKRRQIQMCSESCSFILLAGFAILIVLIPCLCIPSYVIQNSKQTSFQVSMIYVAIISFGLFFTGCIIGNFYWRYEEETNRWRPFLHFGKGPKHYWGWFIFNQTTKHKEAQIV